MHSIYIHSSPLKARTGYLNLLSNIGQLTEA